MASDVKEGKYNPLSHNLNLRFISELTISGAESESDEFFTFVIFLGGFFWKFILIIITYKEIAKLF